MLGRVVNATGQRFFFSFATSLLDRVSVVVIICYRIAFDVFSDPFHLFDRANEPQL